MKSLEEDSERQQEQQGHQTKVEIFLYLEKKFQFDRESVEFVSEDLRKDYFRYQDLFGSEYPVSLLKPPSIAA